MNWTYYIPHTILGVAFLISLASLVMQWDTTRRMANIQKLMADMPKIEVRSKAEQEGELAYYARGGGPNLIPYKEGTQECLDWKRGWDKARRGELL